MNNLPLFYLIVTVLLTSVAQLLQKHAANELRNAEYASPLINNVSFVLSGVLLGISLIAWLQVLHAVDVSVAYPILSLNYVLVLILANRVFGESIPKERWIGVACIIVGVFVLTGAGTP